MKTFSRTIPAVLVALVLIITSVILFRYLTRSTDIPIDADFSVTLERTACFGTCPIYKVTVEGDGTVIFVGDMFVAVEGVQRSNISQSQVRRLAHELEAIDFFSLQESYTDMGATDMPSAITTLRLNGQVKTVVHYHGDFSAPEKLTSLENLIDELTNTAQWINPTGL